MNSTDDALGLDQQGPSGSFTGFNMKWVKLNENQEFKYMLESADSPSEGNKLYLVAVLGLLSGSARPSLSLTDNIRFADNPKTARNIKI